MIGFGPTEFRTLVGKCFEQTEADALDEAALNKTFDELGYDSIGVLEMVVRVQDEYGVTIPDDDLDRLTTPAEFIAYVAARIPVSP